MRLASPYKVISVDEARKLITGDSGVVLLDVRTPEEHVGELGNLGNSLLIPIQTLAQRINELEPHRNKTILAYCRTGNRSGRAAEFLSQHGFSVMNMAGGMVEWNIRGFPVSR